MISKFLGIIGIVLFGFGILGGLVSNSFDNGIVLAHFVIGFILLVFWGIKSGAGTVGNAKQIISGRTTRYGTYVLIYSVLFVGILAAINWLSNRHNKKWDLTEQGVYSLAPQSKELIKNLKVPLKIVTFKGITDDDSSVEELTRRYKDENPGKVSLEVVDPRANPARVKQFEMKQGNILYIEYGDKDKKSVSRINESSEEALSNAILKLTRGAAKKIYVLTGHDEGDIEDAKAGGFKAAKLALEDENLSVFPLMLAQTGLIPSDAAAVIILSAKKRIPVAEKTLLLEYINNGGRLLLASDPQDSQDVADLANAIGIKINKDIVLDQIQRLFSGPQIGAQPISTDYDATSPITNSFSKQTVTIFTMASSIVKSESATKGATYASIVKSSPAAWGETNLAPLLDEANPTATLDDSDNKGPVTLAMSYENPVGSNPTNDGAAKIVSRAVVFGSSSWLANEGIGNYANRDLFINAVNWLVGEEGGYTIRAGTIRASYAPIPQTTFILLLLSCFLIPELLLLLGLWVWWQRRA